MLGFLGALILAIVSLILTFPINYIRTEFTILYSSFKSQKMYQMKMPITCGSMNYDKLKLD